MKPLVTMREALDSSDLFGRVFAGESWAKWRVWLIALMGEELTDEERVVFTGITGRDREPLERVEEAWAICGRRSESHAGGERRRQGGITKRFAVFATVGDRCFASGCEFFALLAGTGCYPVSASSI